MLGVFESKRVRRLRASGRHSRVGADSNGVATRLSYAENGSDANAQQRIPRFIALALFWTEGWQTLLGCRNLAWKCCRLYKRANQISEGLAPQYSG